MTSLTGSPATTASRILASRPAIISADCRISSALSAARNTTPLPSARTRSFGRHRHALDLDRLVEALFDDAAAGGALHGVRCEHREAHLARLVDVAGGAAADDAGDALHLGRGREDAAPACRVRARVLDHDDVTGVRSLDGARAEVTCSRAAVRVHQLHGHDAAGDLRGWRHGHEAQHRARQAEAVAGVRNGAGIEFE